MDEDDPLDTKSSCDICINWKGKLCVGILIISVLVLGIITILTSGK